MSPVHHRFASACLASAFAFALAFGAALPAEAAAKRFVESKDAKVGDEPQKFLSDYDKLVKGKEADWVWFAEGVDLKAFRTVSFPKFTATEKTSEAKDAAEYGVQYLDESLGSSNRIDWKVVKKGADLTVAGNVFNAWEPNAAAEIFGDWMANPGAGIELMGKDRTGRVVFQIRHKSRGSSIEDAVENGLKKIVKALEIGK
jgi:hypothetical protein